MTDKQVLAHRVALGLLQIELAEKLGCSETSIQKWEAGKSPISKRFRLKLEELVRVGREKVDRIMLKVSKVGHIDAELSIDIPTYFKVDTNALYQVVMKELRKQERATK